MTLMELALIRYARQRMRADEVAAAEVLAKRADQGDLNARFDLKRLANEVIADRERAAPDSNKK